MEVVAHYVEFCAQNFSVYSIELASLLFAAASEVDVIAKSLCKILAPAANWKNMNDYRYTLTALLPNFSGKQVFIPRYGLTLTPWDNWNRDTNPDWWRSYNRVKHERDQYFGEATLKNALNALGALLTLTVSYYSHALSVVPGEALPPKEVTRKLEPASSLFRLHEDCYYGSLLV
jgi:hypothetical protein